MRLLGVLPVPDFYPWLSRSMSYSLVSDATKAIETQTMLDCSDLISKDRLLVNYKETGASFPQDQQLSKMNRC